jgi:hypothetical protein
MAMGIPAGRRKRPAPKCWPSTRPNSAWLAAQFDDGPRTIDDAAGGASSIVHRLSSIVSRCAWPTLRRSCRNCWKSRIGRRARWVRLPIPKLPNGCGPWVIWNSLKEVNHYPVGILGELFAASSDCFVAFLNDNCGIVRCYVILPLLII